MLEFSPMNDTTVRLSMYEQVSRDFFIQLICCLAASLKFNSFAIFVGAVDGVGFNFNRYFSSSVYVVVDINQLSCPCATSLQFVVNKGFQFLSSILYMEYGCYLISS